MLCKVKVDANLSTKHNLLRLCEGSKPTINPICPFKPGVTYHLFTKEIAKINFNKYW